MIDIKSELLAIEKKREQDFISIIELLDFLKEHNPNASLPEIATYLLIKLEPHDIRKTDEELWGNGEFERWEDEHGINTYKMPKSISDKPARLTTSYFITALETVRDNEPDPLWDNPTAGAFLREEQKDLSIDRKQIDTILGINTLDKEALNKKYRNEEYLAVAMALTKTGEFVKNTDINKSPVGLAERLVMQQEINQKSDQITQLQARIAELEKENQNLIKPEAVDYDECSIYGHSTEAINAIFGTIERFWINADLTQPDTVANAEDIEKWIGENYNLSNTLKTAVQKITRPEEARYLGRKS
ncbi:hypothetical protein [Ursidibacter sp. B-7004-1]